MAGSSSGAVIQWGNKEPGTDSSYDSMCYKGVWYDLYNCVFCRSGQEIPHVGKLMRLYEDECNVPKVRIRWFLRPYELPELVIKDLLQVADDTKELFIALGSAKGVENDNVVEVILAKASVVCTANYRNNPAPSPPHVDDADHFFNRAYDASKQKLVKIANIENKPLVQKLLNKPQWFTNCNNLEDYKSLPSAKNFDLDVKKRSLSSIALFESSLESNKKTKEN